MFTDMMMRVLRQILILLYSNTVVVLKSVDISLTNIEKKLK